ncbi:MULTISPECIES: hypothetical protein [Bacillaceae]|uniref:Uncharacterized protein n=1 Tax=Ectobacillus funiculus TaxID=137993 RepID=A0ABV5WFJ1_9BACI|nr:hypothetical protein [Ectobacillus funiculus]
MRKGDTVFYNGKHYIVVHIFDNGFVEIGIPELDNWLSVEIVPIVKIEHIVRRKKKLTKKL